MTAQDVISAALRDLGVLAAGEVPSYDDSNDAFISLNNLVDQWAADRLEIYSIVNTTWAIVPNQASYTVGTGGQINIARPFFVDKVTYIDTAPTPDVEYPIGEFTDESWQRLQVKTLTSLIPSDWYYNPTYPLGTLYFWPIPTGTTLQGSIYVATAVTRFAALTTTISLPPGYQRMLQSNLALEIAPQYGAMPSPSLIETARDSKLMVKRSNKRLVDLHFDTAALIGSGGRFYDIRTG